MSINRKNEFVLVVFISNIFMADHVGHTHLTSDHTDPQYTFANNVMSR